MYALRPRGSASAHTALHARHVGVSAFLAHSSSSVVVVPTASCAAHRASALSAVRFLHSAVAAHDADAAAAAPKKRSWKIHSKVSDRRKALEARLAAEEQQAADADAAAETIARATLAEHRRLHPEEYADEEAEAEQLAAAEAEEAADEAAATAPTDIGESQVRGILAKRAALQAIHPLRMLLTSPAQGVDRTRIIPSTLQRAIDTILKTSAYVAGQNDVIQQKNYALWHVANRSAIEFGVLARVFDEIIKRLPSLNPYSLMDYGAATNMSLLALQESLSKYATRSETSGAIERPLRIYRVVESNTGLAKYGTMLTEAAAERDSIDVRYRANLPSLPSDPHAVPLETSSIVCAPFSIGLIEQTDKRNKALDVLWASVAPGGVLVLVEGGTIESFEVIRQSREYLLDKYGMRNLAQRVQPDSAATAANVLAPCGGNGVCPMGDKSLKKSCWHRVEMLSSSLPLRTPNKHLRSKNGVTVETFSYIVLHKGPIRTSVADAEAALKKWRPRPKDLTELGQQGWMAVARAESMAMQDALYDAEEANLGADAAQSAPEKETKLDIYDDPNAVPFHPFNPDGTPRERTPDIITDLRQAKSTASDATMSESNANNAQSQSPEATPAEVPTTKRTSLAPVAHLLPSASVPANVMFDTSYARIIEKPMKRGEHVILDICNESSTALERRIIPRSWGVSYTLARSVSLGDLWCIKKRERDPNAPPTLGEMRKRALKERKAKRAAKLAAMSEEEAELTRQEWNAQRAEAKKARDEAKKETLERKHDAAIIARGGTPPDRAKKAAEAAAKQKRDAENAHEPEDTIWIEPGELDAAGEAELAKWRLPDKPTPPEPKLTKAEKKAAKKAAADEVAQEAEGEAPDAENDSAPTDLAPTKAEGAKKTSATAADGKAKKKKEQPSPELLYTGGVSRMPSWMAPIMAKTRRGEGGGLEYYGANFPRLREHEQDEDDDPNEYHFPPDPTIALATEAQQSGVMPEIARSMQSPEELTEHAKRQKEIARAQRREEKELQQLSPLHKKRPSVEDTPTDDAVSTTAADSASSDRTETDSNTPSATPQPRAKTSSAASTPPKPRKSQQKLWGGETAVTTAATPTEPTFSSSTSSAPSDAPSAASSSPSAPASTDNVQPRGFSAAAAAAAFAASSFGTLDASGVYQPGTPRLPAWAKYRRIKNLQTEPPASTTDKSAQSPSTLDPEAELARHRQNEAVAFHKRELHRKRQAAARGETPANTPAPPSSASRPSSLPAHLVALKQAAMKSPETQRVAAQLERSRAIQNAAAARREQSRSSSAAAASRNFGGRGMPFKMRVQQQRNGIAKRQRY